jgi:hypothetical protein
MIRSYFFARVPSVKFIKPFLRWLLAKKNNSLLSVVKNKSRFFNLRQTSFGKIGYWDSHHSQNWKQCALIAHNRW